MSQLSLFDALHAPPIISAIAPSGDIVRGEPDVTHILPHQRLAWHRGRIELHRHKDGLWMWSTSWNTGNAGAGYRVGPKWGKFAQTKEDALFYAVKELIAGLGDDKSPEAAQIVKWAASL